MSNVSNRKNGVIQAIFFTPEQTPITLISASDCIFYSFASKNPNLSQQEIFAQAYTMKILEIEMTYLLYFIYQDLTEEYLCFFTPKANPNPLLLDLTLPLCFRSKLCCIFILEEKHFFCFYQNNQLVFCKEFETDFKNHLKHIALFFNHQIQEIYCLCRANQEHRLISLQDSHTLLPLLSLYHPSLSFLLKTEHPIILEHFHNLNPQNPASNFKNLKIFGITLGLILFVLGVSYLCLYYYNTHLLKTLDKLNQNISSSSFLSPIEEIQFTHNQNQRTLTSLWNYTQFQHQQTDLLFRIISFLDSRNILSIHFNPPLMIKVHQTPNLSNLLSFLNTIHYRCKITKEEDHLVLEISKL